MSRTHPAARVVQRYMDCSGALDASNLARCFAPNAGLHGFLGPKVVVGSAELYVADVQRLSDAGTDMSTYRASMIAFDVTGDVATATVRMDAFAGARFVDYLQLMREDGEWRIVSKTFTTH